MQRKLFRSMAALSATASVFTLLLLAAGPAQAPNALAGTHAVVVGSAADAALDATDATDDGVAAVHQRHHLHRARALLALPYFSFAQGLRRSRS